MMNNPTSWTIRAKKLGVLIRDARQVTCKSAEECATAMGVSNEIFNSYELGEKTPSLPELELLAYYLRIPPEHFWGSQMLSRPEESSSKFKPQVLLALRQKMVGVMIRKARLESKISVDQLAQQTGIPAEKIGAYELGEIPVPFPELDSLASALGYPLRSFQDQHGPVGSWFVMQRALQDFQELSPDLQNFVSKPVNRPYLELAQRLSEMSVEKLRSVAEGLLEITL